MRVLIGCECSGVVRRTFRKLGHDAWSCDLKPADDGSKYHYQCSVLKVLDKGWDLGIFHPPCTFVLNSGCRWLYAEGKEFSKEGFGIAQVPKKESGRWKAMEDGAKFFKLLLNCKIPRVAVENPIMVGQALKIVGRKYSQKIQPWEFGHMESKATCLWLKHLPWLKPTKNVYKEMMRLPKAERERIHYMSPSEDRGALRSVSYKGIAEAMAQQWGSLPV